MKLIECEIAGLTPLLIQRFDERAQLAKPTRTQLAQHEDPLEAARRVAYIDDAGHFYFSAFAIPNVMGAAGANHKMRSSRKTLKFVVPAAVRICSDTVTILNGDGGPAKRFEVDSRPVTIPATKGRVMRHRPRFDQWSAKFNLQIDDNQLPIETAHQLLAEGGVSTGIGDFRPEKRGPFGTFRVTRFVEVKTT